MKNIIVNLFLIVATLIIILIATELMFRLIKTPVSGWEKKQIWDPQLFTIETPKISWIKQTDEFETEIRVNKKGFRGDSFPSTVDLLFVGDSFTAAHQVNENERFCALLDGVCLGMNGADPIQELAFYRKIGRSMKPKIVVHQIFLFNDIVESGSHITIKNDRIDTIIPQKPKEPFCMMFWNIKSYFLMRVCEFFRYQLTKTPETFDVLKTDEDLKITRIAIQTFKEEVEQDGGRYVLLLIPHPKEIQGMTKLHDRAIEEFSGIDVIDLMEDFRNSNDVLYFPKDGHLTRKGHHRIAEIIRRYLSNPLHKTPYTSTLPQA